MATTDQLTESIDGLYAIENGIRRRLLAAIAEYDRLEAWREDGVCSMTDWLAFRWGTSGRAASELVRVARCLEELPRIADAFEEGRVSWEKVALITHVATPEDEESWLDYALAHNTAQINLAVNHRRRVRRTDEEERLHKRYLRLRWDDREDVLRLSGRLVGGDAALVAKAIERLADKQPRDPTDGTYLPYESRCADALVDLAGARVASESDADRATVVVHVDVRELNKINGKALLEEGPSVTSETVRRLACDGRVQLVLDREDGEPFGVGRVARTVPPYLYRELRIRDRGCRFADCGRTRGLHAHHVRHWAHGGRTDLDNLVLLCRFHHRLVHEGGWRLVLDGRSRLRFVRPDGRPLRACPTPLRPALREHVFGPRAGPP